MVSVTELLYALIAMETTEARVESSVHMEQRQIKTFMGEQK